MLKSLLLLSCAATCALAQDDSATLEAYKSRRGGTDIYKYNLGRYGSSPNLDGFELVNGRTFKDGDFSYIKVFPFEKYFGDRYCSQFCKWDGFDLPYGICAAEFRGGVSTHILSSSGCNEGVVSDDIRRSGRLLSISQLGHAFYVSRKRTTEVQSIRVTLHQCKASNNQFFFTRLVQGGAGCPQGSRSVYSESFFVLPHNGIACPELRPRDGQLLNLAMTDNVFPTRVELNCNTGYEVEGQGEVECYNGRWSESLGSCEPKMCNNPGIPEHGFRSSDNFTVYATVDFSCEVGYELTPSDYATIICLPTTRWNKQVPTCERPDNTTEPETPPAGQDNTTQPGTPPIELALIVLIVPVALIAIAVVLCKRGHLKCCCTCHPVTDRKNDQNDVNVEHPDSGNIKMNHELTVYKDYEILKKTFSEIDDSLYAVVGNDEYAYIDPRHSEGNRFGFIPTRAPAFGNADIWQTAWNDSCDTIVMLCTTHDLGNAVYYPCKEGDSCNVTPFLIECNIIRPGKHISCKLLNVTIPGKEIRQFLHINLLSGDFDLKASEELIEIFLEIYHKVKERKSKYNNKTPAMVHSLRGDQWTGLFCAFACVLDQTDLSREVDISEVLDLLKPPQNIFIYSKEQHMKLCEMVFHLLKSQHLYSDIAIERRSQLCCWR